jgi:F-type H+-transporting ATPase subunit b
VRSSFELEPSLKQKITMALHSVCGSESPIHYETDAEMTLGIEMTFGGLRLSWGVSSYFDSLEKNISDMLEQSAASSSESGKGAS